MVLIKRWLPYIKIFETVQGVSKKKEDWRLEVVLRYLEASNQKSLEGPHLNLILHTWQRNKIFFCIDGDEKRL